MRTRRYSPTPTRRSYSPTGRAPSEPAQYWVTRTGVFLVPTLQQETPQPLVKHDTKGNDNADTVS